MRKVGSVLIALLFFSCAKDTIELTGRKGKKYDDGAVKYFEEQKSSIDKGDFAFLFYTKDELYPVVKKPIKKEPVKVVEKPKLQLNQKDYKVIAEWLLEGKRYIKIRDIKNNAVYSIEEGNKTGDIILLKRELMYYEFLIRGQKLRIER